MPFDSWPPGAVTALRIFGILIIGALAARGARALVPAFVSAVFAREVAQGSAKGLSADEIARRRATIETLGARVLQAFIAVIVALMVLHEVAIDVGPAVAGLGIVGIAVGFGAQSLVRDYFNGTLILLENQFSIGDVVTIAGVSGTVEDLTLRRTTLRDLDGVVHTVPNGEIKVASNRTRTWAGINQDVTVAYGTDIDKAIAVVDRVGREMADEDAWKGRLIEPPHVERVEALAEYGITLKILGSVLAVDQWAAGGELRKRLLSAFAANGIEIPRPQRVILSRDPDGSGPRPPEATVGPGPTEDELAGE